MAFICGTTCIAETPLDKWLAAYNTAATELGCISIDASMIYSEAVGLYAFDLSEEIFIVVDFGYDFTAAEALAAQISFKSEQGKKCVAAALAASTNADLNEAKETVDGLVSKIEAGEAIAYASQGDWFVAAMLAADNNTQVIEFDALLSQPHSDDDEPEEIKPEIGKATVPVYKI